MRRSALVFVTALLVAGCTAGPLGGPAADAVDGPTGCEPVDAPRTDAPNESRPYPDLPATLNRSTARQFALDFEETFAWHRVHDRWLDETNIYTSQVSTGTDATGFVVEIGTVEVSTYDESPEGNTVGDDAWSAVYLVNDSTVLRGEGRAGDDETAPRSEWRTVCERADG